MSNLTAKEQIHDQVISQLRNNAGTNNVFDLVSQSVQENYPLITQGDAKSLITSVVNDISGYGFLEMFLNDESITEIMVNTPNSGYIEKAGKLIPINFSSTQEDLFRVAQKFVSHSGTKFDKSSPIVDAWLSDGSRVNAVLPPIASDGPYITIRRFSPGTFKIENFCENQEQQQLVESLISNSRNIVFAGSTSSGKTTLMNACMDQISTNQRIISIEETAELSSKHPHHVRLLAKSANSEGTGAVTMANLVKTSLRMRPDRLVIGEVRSAEAFDLIQALNTGHAGSMCTIHANGPREVIHRLASLAMFAHSGLDYEPLITQTVFGLDVIVYVKRGENGIRKIDSVYELIKESNDYSFKNMMTQESLPC